MSAEAIAPTIEVLRDSFGRIRAQVIAATANLPQEVAQYRIDSDANSIAWLLWHLIRVQDDHLAGAAGTEQIWTEQRWYQRSGLPFPADAIGYGHTSAEVGQVDLDATFLADYHGQVHDATLRYLDALTVDELARIVDHSWDPPVTASVRIVSVMGDCLAHLGQIQFIQGIAMRQGLGQE